MKRQLNLLQPASRVVALLGGCRQVAAHLNLHPTTVWRWCAPVEIAGTGGKIPQKHWPHLLALAKQQRRRLGLKDLSGM
jgi:hypothetical protein